MVSCCKPETPTRSREECEALMASAENVIRRTVRAMVFNPTERYDIAQMARLAIWNAMSRFDPARCRFTTWAAGVTKNVILRATSASGSDLLTRTDHWAPYGDEFDFDRIEDRRANDDEDELCYEADPELAARVDATFASSTESARRLVRAIVVEGRTPAQIAVELGEPTRNVICALRNVARGIVRRRAKASQLAAR